MKKIISFDLSSGDKGTTEALKAAVSFSIDNPDWKIIGFSADEISLEGLPANLEIIMCDEVIDQNAGALEIRRKTNSTLVKAIQSVESGDSSGVISAAGSGPLVVAGYLIFRSIEGLKPAFSPLISTIKGKLMVVLDVGANIGADAKTLNQYAEMGTILAKVLNISQEPIVMQLNIGEEAKKGTELQKEAYKLMESNSKINFKGNIEPNNLLTNENVDVIVTEAFSGNIALKSYEGSISQFKKMIKDSMKESILDKIGFSLSSNFRNRLNVALNKKSGGAVVVGLNHLLVKAHGSSDKDLLYNSLEITKSMIENDLISRIKEEVNG